MQVQDILKKKSSEVFTIRSHQPLADAIKMLADKNIGVLVVVDEQNQPVGVLSERDIVRELAHNIAGMESLKVSHIMTKDVIIALPEDDLTYLSNTMTNKRIRHLPVMQDGKLIGIVSIGDVVKAQLDFYEVEAHTLRQYITGGYS